MAFINLPEDTIKVSNTDTSDGFIIDKIIAGSNITITKLTPGADEKLEIAGTGSGINSFSTITGDTGSATADTGADTLGIVGIGAATTVATNDPEVLTVDVPADDMIAEINANATTKIDASNLDVSAEVTEVNATSTVMTTSTTFVIVPSMSITVTEAGDFLCDFRSVMQVSNNSVAFEIAVFVDGIEDTNSTREFTLGNSSAVLSVSMQPLITGVTSSQVIDFRWRKSAGGAPQSASIFGRNFLLQKVV